MFKVNIQNFFLRFLQKWPLILQKLSFLLKIFVKECKVFVKNSIRSYDDFREKEEGGSIYEMWPYGSSGLRTVAVVSE